MGSLFFKAGAYAYKAFGGFFKGVSPSHALAIFGTGTTVGGLWNSVSGWFSNTANQGAVNDDDEGGVMDTLEEAFEKASVALSVAGFLLVTLIVVLGWKAFGKALK